MPRRVPKEAKRVPLNCLVLPETLAWLRAADVSQGVAVDLAVARAKAHIADGWQPISAKAGDVRVSTVKPLPRSKKASTQTFKRGPRQKGDPRR